MDILFDYTLKCEGFLCPLVLLLWLGYDDCALKSIYSYIWSPFLVHSLPGTDPSRNDDRDRLRCGWHGLTGGVAAGRNDDNPITGAARGGQHAEGGRHSCVATEALQPARVLQLVPEHAAWPGQEGPLLHM